MSRLLKLKTMYVKSSLYVDYAACMLVVFELSTEMNDLSLYCIICCLCPQTMFPAKSIARQIAFVACQLKCGQSRVEGHLCTPLITALTRVKGHLRLLFCTWSIVIKAVFVFCQCLSKV